jgi:hypothetical protein
MSLEYREGGINENFNSSYREESTGIENNN